MGNFAGVGVCPWQSTFEQISAFECVRVIFGVMQESLVNGVLVGTVVSQRRSEGELEEHRMCAEKESFSVFTSSSYQLSHFKFHCSVIPTPLSVSALSSSSFTKHLR